MKTLEELLMKREKHELVPGESDQLIDQLIEARRNLRATVGVLGKAEPVKTPRKPVIVEVSEGAQIRAEKQHPSCWRKDGEG